VFTAVLTGTELATIYVDNYMTVASLEMGEK